MALLARDAGWRTAGELADLVGVTPRSIRSYVAALNARVPGGFVPTGILPVVLQVGTASSQSGVTIAVK